MQIKITNIKYVISGICVIGTSLLLCCCANPELPDVANRASFTAFEYQGKDEIFAAPLPKGEFQNPILAGFYPDPSITRAGDDYYLVHSSFAYSPGVPIFRSRDLVNWESLGHILVTPEQLPLQNQQVSRGIYAPTIRYHEGIFYLITTLVDVRGNFIVTTTDPAGPWSEPILLPEIGGIDPDIFFDDDGRVYIAHNDSPVGEPLYEGHRAIWLWEFDLARKKIVKNSGRVIVNGGTDLAKKPVWIEAPHILKKNGWYYLSCAEGGTGAEHSQVIFRTRDLSQPFIPFEKNPILTQRDLDKDRPNPITSAGHADMVETAADEWWAVFLATRAYDQTYYNTGRETFLLPVHWENEWPVILEPKSEIPYRLAAPKITGPKPVNNIEPLTGNFTWRDSFTSPVLQSNWNLLRSDTHKWYHINASEGRISLDARPFSLADLAQPAFIGRRQQHMHYSAAVELQMPETSNISAGLAVFQSELAHYYLGIKRVGTTYQIFIEQANQSKPTVIKSLGIRMPNSQKSLTLGTEGNKGKISFYYELKPGKKIYIAQDLDGKLLSTAVAGGFVGSYIGLHSRSETASVENP